MFKWKEELKKKTLNQKLEIVEFTEEPKSQGGTGQQLIFLNQIISWIVIAKEKFSKILKVPLQWLQESESLSW